MVFFPTIGRTWSNGKAYDDIRFTSDRGCGMCYVLHYTSTFRINPYLWRQSKRCQYWITSAMRSLAGGSIFGFGTLLGRLLLKWFFSSIHGHDLAFLSWEDHHHYQVLKTSLCPCSAVHEDPYLVLRITYIFQSLLNSFSWAIIRQSDDIMFCSNR